MIVEMARSADCESQKWTALDEEIDLVKLLDDEKFDFDLPLSPDLNSGNSLKDKPRIRNEKELDEEEVFFGPVGYKETCVATAVNEELKEAEKFKPIGELSARDMAQLCQEAFKVSCRIRLETGSGDMPELAARPTEKHSASPSFTFSDLDDVFKNFSKILPVEKQLSCDKNGVVKFQGSQSKEQTVERKQERPSNLRQSSGVNLLRLAKASSLHRLKPPLRPQPISQQMYSIPDSLPSCLASCNGEGDQTQPSVEKSPLLKRIRNQDGVAHRNNNSSCTDYNQSDSLNGNRPTGKRRFLASPKIKVNTFSRLPQLTSAKPSQIGSSVVGSEVASEIGDAARMGANALKRTSLIHMDPIDSRQEPKTQVALVTVSAETDSLSTTALPAPKTNLMMSSAIPQRRILTASRNLMVGSRIGKGPVKAVATVDGNSTLSGSLAQVKDTQQMKLPTLTRNAAPQINRKSESSSGEGSTLGFISRIQPLSGLPTFSRSNATQPAK